MSRIAIVGAGIGGLTLAAALDPGRHEITLLEGQPHRAGAGAALGLWPSALRALGRIGVDVAAHLGADGDGDPPGGPTQGGLSSAGLFDITTGERLAGAPRQAGALTLVPRPALLAALEAAVPARVRRVHEEVTDPEALDADLVVGADGVRSRVRALVHPGAAERRQTPWLALRGISPHPPPPGSVGEYWGPGLLAGITPVGAGTYWFTTHRSTLGPEPLDLSAALAEAGERFARATPAVREQLRGAGAQTLANRLWVTPTMPRYAHDRYVVIGDAAHATTPNLGRGAVDAILDAASLAQALNRGAGLRTWQLRRVPATQATRAIAPLVMRLALAGTGTGVRDGVLRGAGLLSAVARRIG